MPVGRTLLAVARAEDAARRAELAASTRRAEAARAQRLIDDFVAAAERAGIAAEPLQARLLTGQRVRTDRSGWYLRRDRSIAIGTDGGYYALLVPGGLRERFRGARLQPSPPPMIVGRGGKDGETGDLSFFLDRRLAEG
ncbi:hypothetical protein [Microlunatus soli]|uniref:Uncharacterized protein n=1 Tax=Microlunatus soli TaxID=630515 RepID=A0A1H1UMN8_9ACTN|nr:hypothetical protein [Microlunatus soli]SDS73794.1 hypothetical protein SAMN04489812_2856 [Microlunatus soli]